MVEERSYKPPTGIEATGRPYTVQLPFTSRRVPDGVRLEGWGHGGLGVAFVEARNRSLVLLPGAVRAVRGPVSNPTAVLRDDSAWSFLGSADILAAMHTPALAAERGLLDISLRTR